MTARKMEREVSGNKEGAEKGEGEMGGTAGRINTRTGKRG